MDNKKEISQQQRIRLKSFCMGSYFSNMDNEEHLEPVSDSDDDLFQNIQDDDLSEHYLVIILRQLIDRYEANNAY